jgi:hypothetical protein
MNLNFKARAVCFVCGGKIRGYRVHWEGWKGKEVIDIDLHQRCADWMASAMKRDVIEFSLGQEAANHWYRSLGFKRPVAHANDVHAQPPADVVAQLNERFD